MSDMLVRRMGRGTVILAAILSWCLLGCDGDGDGGKSGSAPGSSPLVAQPDKGDTTAAHGIDAANNAANNANNATASASGPTPTTTPTADGWLAYRDAEHGFQVVGPIKPRTTRSQSATVIGLADVAMYQFDADGSLIVSVAQHPLPESFSIDAALDGARDGMVRSSVGTLSSSETLSVNGVPGRSMKISASAGAHGKIVMVARVFYRQERLFTVLAVAKVGDDDALRDGKRFVDSFAFTSIARAATGLRTE